MESKNRQSIKNLRQNNTLIQKINTRNLQQRQFCRTCMNPGEKLSFNRYNLNIFKCLDCGIEFDINYHVQYEMMDLGSVYNNS